MKVNDPNLSSAGAAQQAHETARTGETQKHRVATPPAGTVEADDVHLSQLVRNLRALAADSPERQALVDKLEQVVAEGGYKVDANAVSKSMVEDALRGR